MSMIPIAPIVILVLILGLAAVFLAFLKNYIKVPPEKAAVIYGRKQIVKVVDAGGVESKRERGFRLVRGGAALVFPFFEKASWLDLSLMTIGLTVNQVPSADGVPVNVEAIANVKIGGTDDALEKAAEQFGGKTISEIQTTVRETMEGHLRAIVGQLTPEELYKDRQRFSQEVQKAATEDIASMGFEIVTFPVKDVRDSEGYIDALGKRRVAEVKMEAAIGEANAKRKEMVETSLALREGKEAELKNDQAVAEAQRDLAMKTAGFKAEVDKANATADQAGPLAEAEALKGVKQAQVAAEEAETEARIGLAEKESLRKEKELVATVVKPAEAARQKIVIEAKAGEEAAEHNAKAVRLEADAAKEKTVKEGQGLAEALLAKGNAEAGANKAKLLAVADGKEADLLAEAKGKLQLASALAKLDDTGKLLQVLEELPKVLTAGGDALAVALGPNGLAAVFGQIAAPMGSIDEIKILDMGGGSGNGKEGNPVSRLANIGPDIVFNFLAKAKALGLGSMLEKYGISSELVDGFMSSFKSNPEGAISDGLKKIGEAISVKADVTGQSASSDVVSGQEETLASAEEESSPLASADDQDHDQTEAPDNAEKEA